MATSKGVLFLVLLLPGADAAGRRAELRGAMAPVTFFNDPNPAQQERADQLTHEVNYWNSKYDESQKDAKKAHDHAANGALEDAKHADHWFDGDGEDDDDLAPEGEGEDGDDLPPSSTVSTGGQATPPGAAADGELTQAQQDPATAPSEAKALTERIAALKAQPNRTAEEEQELASSETTRQRWAALLVSKPELTPAEQVELSVLEPRAQHNAALKWAAMIPDGKAGDFNALTKAASKAMHSNDDNLALAAAKALVQGETHVSNTVFEFNPKAAAKLCDEFQRIREVENELWREIRAGQTQEQNAMNSFAELDDTYEDNSMELTEAAVNHALKNNTADYCRLNVAGEEWGIEEAAYEKDIDTSNAKEFGDAAKAERPHMFETAAAFREYKAVNNAYKAAKYEEKLLSNQIEKSNATIAGMKLHCDEAEAALAGETTNLKQLQMKLDQSLDAEKASKENLDLVQQEVLRMAIKLWRLREKRHALKQAVENMGETAVSNCPELNEEPLHKYDDEGVDDQESNHLDPDVEDAVESDSRHPFHNKGGNVPLDAVDDQGSSDIDAKVSQDDPRIPADGNGAAGMDEGVGASAAATAEAESRIRDGADADDPQAVDDGQASSLLEAPRLATRWVPPY